MIAVTMADGLIGRLSDPTHTAAVGYARCRCLFGPPQQISGQIAELEKAAVITLIITPLAGDSTFSLPRALDDSFAVAGLLRAP